MGERSNELASGLLFWKEQYVARNEEFKRLKALADEIEFEICTKYELSGFDDGDSLLRGLADIIHRDCMRSGYFELLDEIYDKFEITIQPSQVVLNVLQYIESGEKCRARYLPAFYAHTFLLDENMRVGKREGRNTMTVTIEVVLTIPRQLP